MKRLLGLIMLLGSLTTPTYAALEDIAGLRIYENASTLSWGKQFLNLFNQSNYNKSYALIIGISEFDHFKTLPKNDPERMRNYLLNEAGFDEVYVLTDRHVKLPSIRQLMEDELPAKIKANDRFLFYWSGHGATRKDSAKPVGYLPLSNSQPEQYSSMLGMQALAQWDELLTAKQTLYLLDACFSGAAGHVPKSDMRNLTLDQIARPSRQMLTAGLANEETIALSDGSLFTTAVIDGLRGEADAITSTFPKDGIVSMGELEQYVKKRVAFESDKAGWTKSITPLLTRLSHHEGDFFFFSPQTVRMANSGELTTTEPTINKEQTPIKKDKYPNLGVVSGSDSGTYHRMINDLESVINKSNLTFNLENKTSVGSKNNIKRITSSHENAAFGIVQSDIKYNNASIKTMEKLRLMSPLHHEEIHLFARNNITSIQDLNGKIVNAGSKDSGSFHTASIIFKILGITPQYIHESVEQSLNPLSKSNKVDALFYVGGQPLETFSSLPEYITKDFHFLPINLPEHMEDSLGKSTYKKAFIHQASYPWMKEKKIETVFLTALLVAYDFAGRKNEYQIIRCKQLEELRLALEASLEELKTHGHPKWREVVLSNKADGWITDKCFNEQ